MKCDNCNLNPVWKEGLCLPCHTYQQLHGRPRPASLYLHQQHCINCGAPRDYTIDVGFIYGICPACYRYMRRYGRTRPPQLWFMPPDVELCECGQPAEHVVRVRICRHYEIFVICADCYAAEMEMRTITYSDVPRYRLRLRGTVV
jgi:hypothetical protein